MTQLWARQGDLVVEKLAEQLVADDLIERSDLVFAGDSSGHRHRLIGTVLVASQAQGRTRFRVPSVALPLVHEKGDGHETVELAPGDYEIRVLRERGDGQDRQVED
jgi:hypothetical protein